MTEAESNFRFEFVFFRMFFFRRATD